MAVSIADKSRLVAAYTPTAGNLGTNAEYSLDARGILTVKIDLNERHGASSSGKTTIVATTSGNKHIDGSGGVIIGLNAYIKA